IRRRLQRRVPGVRPKSRDTGHQGTREKASNANSGDWRQTATAWVAIAGTAAVVVGLILTNAANRATQHIAEQGQVTDRFGKAIDQLGSGNLDIRLGGIYALERLMHDSSSDEANIIEVLGAYVRDHTAKTSEHTTSQQPTAQPTSPQPTAPLTSPGQTA